MKTILLTGFEPFGKYRVNPSWEAIKDVGPVRGWRLVARRLPVSYRRAAPSLKRWLKELRPAAVVAFGVTGEGPIRLERMALNVNHSEEPDNDRRRVLDRPIVRKSPLALESRLPLHAIYKRLRRARIPVKLSFSAGTYLCNNIFYTLLASTRAPAGFIHVPPLPTARKRKGRLPMRTLRRMVETVVTLVTSL